ncbi:MAG: lysoplasmalogenase [Panacibacter sp.]
MKRSEIILAVIFWLLLIADCILIKEGLNEYRLFTKILLVPVLLVGIFNATEETKHRRSKVLANLAFFFCFLGDFFLLGEGNNGYFIAGLGSFMLAHIFFTIFFFRLKKFTDKYRIFLFANGFLIFGYMGFLLFLSWNGVKRQNLEIPIAVYAFVLGMMVLTAVHSINNKSIKRISKNYFVPGALLFVLSDSLLAFDKFVTAFVYGPVAVMVTYAAAIFFLYLGVVRFLKK